MNEMNIGGRIAEMRKAMGLTQEQLASRLGVSYQAVSKWENGQSCPDIQLLPQIADIFDISLDALFGRAFAQSAAEARSEPDAQAQEYYVEGLPWPDDNTLHIVLYRGQQLITRNPIRVCRELKEIPFVYEGPALNVDSVLSVHVQGPVQGNVNAGDDVSCGDVAGSLSAGDNVHCGHVYGDLRASDSVTCTEVAGDVVAGDGVRCGNVGGNVRAGDSVHCGDISGNVTAGDGVRCTSFRESSKSTHVHINADELDEDSRNTVNEIVSGAKDLANSASQMAGEISARINEYLRGKK